MADPIASAAIRTMTPMDSGPSPTLTVTPPPPLPQESFVASNVPVSAAVETHAAAAQGPEPASSTPIPAPAQALPVQLADLETPVQPAPLSLARATAAVPMAMTPHTVDLGPGFPSVAPTRPSNAERLHALLAYKLPGPYGSLMDLILKKCSGLTVKAAGVDLPQLLGVDRTLYQTLAPSDGGYEGSLPLFQAIANGQGADGQGAYVNLGPKYAAQADHLTRLFSNLPLESLRKLPVPAPPLDAVWNSLLARAQAGKFPVYISLSGNPAVQTPTDAIATESLASIAQRENGLGSDFPDPRDYYNWLVTRVRSNYQKVDPWLSAVNPRLQHSLATVKSDLTPPWLVGHPQDPFGAGIDPRKSQDAYRRLMGLCGGGQPPSWQNMADYADAVVGLDRDLVSGVQTYWIKMLREASPEQRTTLLAPLAKAWVSLNLLAPGDPQFGLVSPDNAPIIDLIDRVSGKHITERYDRAMALGEVVEHSLDGLGIDGRQQFMDLLSKEVRSRRPDIEARETRVRGYLGSRYPGVDVDDVLDGSEDARDPQLVANLNALRNGAYGQQPVHPMTAQYAEALRHFGLLDWMANRHQRYGDVDFGLVWKSPDFKRHPLMVSEFYNAHPAPNVAPIDGLPPGPSHSLVLGQPVAGQAPVKASIVLEGGGGKGFAYPECLRQLSTALQNQQGQVAVDEFCGTSAGAITAGILACGFNLDDLQNVMQQLDFQKFYADYMWLSGGVDPKDRGIDRTGLFSMQGMYQALYKLMSQKLGVQGRPILFRDLPFKLKVVSTVLNDNLPADLKKQLGVGPDGQVVFSDENTPNMDVVAAICASASVPSFFNAPQIQVARQTGDDMGDAEMSRMQMMDGGTVNNFPVATASHEAGQASALVVLPAYCQDDGKPPVVLSTLNFDPSNLAAINAYNDKRYADYMPQVAAWMQAARQQNVGRVVIGMHLGTPTEQTGPIVQGQTAAQTDRLQQAADSVGLQHLSAADGRHVVDGLYRHKTFPVLEQVALKDVLDNQDTVFTPGVHRDPTYQPRQTEATGLADLLTSVVAASLTAPSQLKHKQFEVG